MITEVLDRGIAAGIEELWVKGNPAVQPIAAAEQRRTFVALRATNYRFEMAIGELAPKHEIAIQFVMHFQAEIGPNVAGEVRRSGFLDVCGQRPRSTSME